MLLLTLFFRHFPKLVETGHLYIAKPPLFRVDAPARGKKPASKTYALDEGELTAILDKLRKEGVREGSWNISRFKGLGEMLPNQLRDTTMDPAKRSLLRVSIPLAKDETDRREAMRTAKLVEDLMGRKPEKRFAFIQENAQFARDLDV